MRSGLSVVRADHNECDLTGALQRRDPIDAVALSHQYV